MAWHLSDDVSMAVAGGDLIFLDVAQDAYLCLPGGARTVRRDVCGLIIEDHDLALELAQAGLVEARTGARIAQRPAPTPEFDLGALAVPQATRRERLAFGGTIFRMRRRYHGKSLSQLVGFARARGEGMSRYSGRAPAEALIRRAAVFDRLLPWAPRQEACLFRSFMLLSFLREQAQDANWVFGVRTRPFEAHCWVQAGPVVLNDSLDHVRNFVPIMVT